MNKKNSFLKLLIILFSFLFFLVSCNIHDSNDPLKQNSFSISRRNTQKPSFQESTNKNIFTVQYLQNMSVFVGTALNERITNSGTGVLAKRDDKAYVWSVAHIFEYQKKSDEKINEVPQVNENPEVKEKILSKIGDKTFVSILYRVNNKIVSLSSQGTIIATSPMSEEDLVLIELSLPARLIPSQGVSWYNKSIMSGMDVYHIGNMRGRYGWSATKGIVSFDSRFNNGKRFFQTDHMVISGSSGGGVFLSDTRECLGLVSSIDIPGINFIIPYQRIREFAKKNGYEWVFDPRLPKPANLPNTHPNVPVDKEREKYLEKELRDYGVLGD